LTKKLEKNSTISQGFKNSKDFYYLTIASKEKIITSALKTSLYEGSTNGSTSKFHLRMFTSSYFFQRVFQ
jgi:high-affinity K+ transport system ATPase subunit B